MNTEPSISPEIDRLIDIIEAAGGSWNLIWGSSAVPAYLAFGLPETSEIAPSVLEAMCDFDRSFRSDAKIREDVFNWALSIGAAYCNSDSMPVLDVGATRQ